MKRKAIIALILLFTVSGAGVYRGYAIEKEKQVTEAIVSEAKAESQKVQDAQDKQIIDSWADKVYPGVTLMGVDLTGLTKNEVKILLDTEVMSKLKGHTINISAKDKVFPLTLEKLDIFLDSDKLAEDAISYGKNLSDEEKLKKIGSAEDATMDIAFDHNEEKISEFIKSLTKEVNQEARNATIKRANGAFSVTDHAEGRVVDADKLMNDIKSALADLQPDQTINAEIVVSQPRVTADELKQIDGQLSSYTTQYGSAITGRTFNIEHAASKINGAVVLPGETFSYNGQVGPVTAATGFRNAGVFIGDKVEQGIGGGLCQVSSTLYQAALHSNLEVDQRRNHSMVVAYLKPGLDAVVYSPYLDLKFTNRYEHPIYIQAYGNSGILTVSVYGHMADMGGYKYKIYSETTSVIQPKTVRKEDPTMFEDEEKVEFKPVTGYTSKTYKQTIKDGKVVKTEQISNDSYKKVDEVILYGTKKKPVVAPPVVTPPTTPPVVTPPTTPPVVTPPTTPAPSPVTPPTDPAVTP